MSTPALKASNLQRRAGRKESLSGFDLSLMPGEFLALLGPAGCGKTTVLRILAGLMKPSFGRVSLCGRDITGLKARERELSAVFPDTKLSSRRTVLGHVLHSLKVHGVARAERLERAQTILSLMGLSGLEDRRPRRLNTVQRRKAVLCCALAPCPKALLMDDPFFGLEAMQRKEALEVLRLLQKRWNLSILYATRDQDEAAAISDRVALMLHGHVEQTGTFQELYWHPLSREAALYLGTASLLSGTVAARQPGGLVALETQGLTLPVRCFGPAPAIGEPAYLCLRPEQVSLCLQPGPGSLISGILKGFREGAQGRHALVRLSTGAEVICAVPQGESPSVGSRVFLAWDVGQAALIPGEEDLPGKLSEAAGRSANLA